MSARQIEIAHEYVARIPRVAVSVSAVAITIIATVVVAISFVVQAIAPVRAMVVVTVEPIQVVIVPRVVAIVIARIQVEHLRSLRRAGGPSVVYGNGLTRMCA